MRAVGRIAMFLLIDDDLNREREYYYHLSACDLKDRMAVCDLKDRMAVTATGCFQNSTAIGCFLAP